MQRVRRFLCAQRCVYAAVSVAKDKEGDDEEEGEKEEAKRTVEAAAGWAWRVCLEPEVVWACANKRERKERPASQREGASGHSADAAGRIVANVCRITRR